MKNKHMVDVAFSPYREILETAVREKRLDEFDNEEELNEVADVKNLWKHLVGKISDMTDSIESAMNKIDDAIDTHHEILKLIDGDKELESMLSSHIDVKKLNDMSVKLEQMGYNSSSLMNKVDKKLR